MRRATLLLGLALALTVSLLTPSAAQADSAILSASDQQALKFINSEKSVRVNILLNAQATHWYASRTRNQFTHLGFGWYTVRVTKEQARFVFASMPDGSVNANHRYKVASTDNGTSALRGPGNSPEVADFSGIVRARNVNQAGNRGSGQSVAIIDTGIYADHPFFKNTAGTATRIVAQGCFVNTGSFQSYPCLNGQSTDFGANAADISGASSAIQMTLEHGSHVAGIAAGNKGSVSNPSNDLTDGVAPDANIIPLRVFGGDSAYDVDILSAMSWVVAHADQYNIASVNLSLGSDPDYTCSAQTVDGYSSYVTAFTNLINAGVAPLVASGNDGAGTSNAAWNVVTNPSGLGIGVPACVNPAISVASTDYNNVISWFSNVNYGIDLAAPGHWIYSSVPYASDSSGFTYMRGTSMATPVVAGGFALAKAASPNTSITDWLGLMRDTGTLIDDVIVQDIPQLNIEAAIGATGLLSAPSNVVATWPLVHEFSLTWSAPTYGPTPTGYQIQYDDVTVDVGPSTFSYNGPIKHPDTFVIISSLDGQTVGPSVVKTVLPQSNQTARVARSTSQFIERAYLGGDKCVASVTERVVLQYDSPSLVARTIYILDGEGGSTTVTETKLSPAPAGLTTSYARQLVINSPTTVLKPTSRAYFKDSQNRVGIGYNLSNAYSIMQSSPQSPPDIAGISATPGRLSASVSWTDPASSAWRVYVDGVSQGNVSNRNVSLSLSAGNHTVGVCAVSQTVNGEYSSNLTQISFNVSNKLSQSITASGPSSVSLSSPTANITASATSGLPVGYLSSTPSVCTVSNTGEITAVNAGSCLVSVSQAGNADYSAAIPSVVGITVLQPQTISISNTPALTLGSSTQSISAAASSGLPLTYASATPERCLVGSTTGIVSAVSAGECFVTLSQPGNAQYDAVSQQISILVLRPYASVVRTVKASVVSRKLILSWSAPANYLNAGITKYVVKYRVGLKGKWKAVNVTSRKWTSVAFTRGTRIYFSIYAVNVRGNGAVYSSSKLIS